MIHGLDLFSGIGGISIALEPWVRPIAYCENDKYAQAVLLSRQQEGLLQTAPIWDDIRTLHASRLPKIDIIYGGFPCQDISVAGNAAGLEGERSGLFYEIIRLTKEINPPFVFLENVSAIRTRGLREVIRAFTDLRYDCRWTCVSAAEVGAPHLRKRWFLLAHSLRFKLREQSRRRFGKSGKKKTQSGIYGQTQSMAYSNSTRKLSQFSIKSAEQTSYQQFHRSYWSAEPPVGRVVNGLLNRMDRIKCLGNAVVPLQAREAFERLIGIKQ